MRRCRTLGAGPVLADALDPEAVAQAVAAAEPEVIVHQLTALSGKMRARDVRHPERSSMAKMTNRLRTEATDHLLAAGRAVGARRFVAQSIDACDAVSVKAHDCAEVRAYACRPRTAGRERCTSQPVLAQPGILCRRTR
jgi:hypothetical protein